MPHTGDLTIRGGYGLFYGNPDEQTGVGNMMTNNPPFVGVGSVNLVGDKNNPSTAFNLSGSLPATQVVSPQNFVFDPGFNPTLLSWPTYYKAPVVNQWNLSIGSNCPAPWCSRSAMWATAAMPTGTAIRATSRSLPAREESPLAAAWLSTPGQPITIFGPWDRSHYEGMTARLEKRMTRVSVLIRALPTAARST